MHKKYQPINSGSHPKHNGKNMYTPRHDLEVGEKREEKHKEATFRLSGDF